MEFLVRRVQRFLVVSIGMSRSHQALYDAETLVKDLNNRGQAVGRARGIGKYTV